MRRQSPVKNWANPDSPVRFLSGELLPSINRLRTQNTPDCNQFAFIKETPDGECMQMPGAVMGFVWEVSICSDRRAVAIVFDPSVLAFSSTRIASKTSSGSVLGQWVGSLQPSPIHDKQISQICCLPVLLCLN